MTGFYMDKGLLNGVIFLDLKLKAFHTMDHEILQQKLKLYGVCQASLNWFASHVTERTQKTFVDGVLSDSSTIKCRIPQGSILGPLLFIIYINDLPSCDLYSKARMYADDTSLTVAHFDNNTLEQLMNHDFLEIHSWLITNKLSLNVIKAKYMIVASQYRIKHLEHQFNIQVNNHYLTRDNSYKYLGVEIDQSLTRRDHVVKIAKKASGGIGALRRVRHLIPRKAFVTMLQLPCTNIFRLL